MSDTVIRVENLGKKYVIGHKQEGERYTALRDVIASSAKGVVDRFRNPKLRSRQSEMEEFWALKDVSFEIKQGDRVGIIGRNGAGKSTLLKVLSRITEPTEGRVSIKGRVASLLEVGTGFHQELTGRENIFLNGSILGMDKVEIRRRFDEIIDFAEIEQFLDTPVKRYSSGMRIRLGFAVAAHLTTEILIVDEVLAVGDIAFQNKCLGKMEDVSQNEGRTVLFVSHNMSVVDQLCSRGLLLEKGNVVLDSTASNALNRYSDSNSSQHASKTKVKAFSEKHQMGLMLPAVNLTRNGSNLDMDLSVVAESSLEQKGVGISVKILTQQGYRVAHIGPRLHRVMLPPFEGNIRYSLRFSKVDRYLAGGTYLVSFVLKRPGMERITELENAVEFTLPVNVIYPDGVPYTAKDFGPIVLRPDILLEAV